MNNITELAQLLRENGDKIISSEFKLNLSVSLLTTLNDIFVLYPSDSYDENTKNSFEILKGNNADISIQIIHDFIQKTLILCLKFLPNDPRDKNVDISRFKNLKCLEIQKLDVKRIKGIRNFRTRLETLKCTQYALSSFDEILIFCGADNSSSFSWNNLIKADFSFNNLQKIDNSFEFAQNLKYLNLSHNKLSSADGLNVLPNLVFLDLSFNCLTKVPSFHVEASFKLEILNLYQNMIETLNGMARLESLMELNLCNNCFIDHKDIASLSTLQSLTKLSFVGNPISFHPKHRQLTSSNLHLNAANKIFYLDGIELNKKEKSNCGKVVINAYHHHTVTSRPSLKTNSTSVISKTLTDSISSDSSSVNRSNITSTRVSKNEKSKKKKNSRLIDLETDDDLQNSSFDNTLIAISPNDREHLIAKKHIENLREQYGVDWLKKSNYEISENNVEDKNDFKIEEFLNDLEINHGNGEYVNYSSTPINNITTSTLTCNSASNFSDEKKDEDSSSNTVDYQCDKDFKEDPILQEIYKNSDITDEFNESEQEEENIQDILFTYNAVNKNTSKTVILLVSSDFITEKDISSNKTISKWKLKILESCDRLKSNTLRINFDTLRKDKNERIYLIEDETNCSELEKYLRNILSDRSLCEMNQQIFKCLNCSCHFSVEKKSDRRENETNCPECGSLFISEQDNAMREDISVDILSNSNSSKSSSVEVLPEEKPAHKVIENLALEANEFTNNSIFDTIIESTNNLLMSKSQGNEKLSTNSNTKYKFNYVDFADVDHRIKLYFLQTKFQDSDEQFRWIVKTKLYIESSKKFVESGVIVMSTKYLYIMQIFSLDYVEDISKWMRQLNVVSIDNIDIVDLLPYNVGVCVHLKTNGSILLLLQDYLRCESFVNFMALRKELPSKCRLYREKCLHELTTEDQNIINMLVIINNVTLITKTTSKNFDTTILYITQDTLHLNNSDDFQWLLPKSDSNIKSSFASQSISNLIDIKNITDNRFSMCFLEETLNNEEVWDCMFETKGSLEYCLNKIDSSWSTIFGVSLLNN